MGSGTGSDGGHSMDDCIRAHCCPVNLRGRAESPYVTGLRGDGGKKGVVFGPEAAGPDLGWGPILVKLFGSCQKAKEQEDQGDPMAQYTSVRHQLLRYVPRDEFRGHCQVEERSGTMPR